MPGDVDKRRFPRIPSKNAVLVTRLEGDAGEEFARTEVVGLGGCMFTSEESFGAGTTLELLITISHEVVRVRTRVIWERPVDGQFEIGVEFLELSETEREWIGVLLEDQGDR